MENMTVSVTPLQALLSLLFWAWLIIFPLLIIKKLNYITELLQAQFEDEGSDDDTPAEP